MLASLFVIMRLALEWVVYLGTAGLVSDGPAGTSGVASKAFSSGAPLLDAIVWFGRWRGVFWGWCCVGWVGQAVAESFERFASWRL